MTITTDVTTNIGKVRLLIPDRGPVWFAFTDEEINTFLTLEDSNIRLAAAMALEVMASDRALVQGVTETLDLKVDGAKVADSLLKRAQMLREQGDEQNVFGIIEFGDLTVWNAQEYYIKNSEFADGYVEGDIYG